MSPHFAALPPRTLACALILAGLAACSTATPTGARRGQTTVVAPVPAAAPTTATGTSSATALPADVGRLLVRRAALDVEVPDPDLAAARARAVVAGVGGYVERERRGDRSADFTLRVPEARLDLTLDSLASLGTVKSRRLSTDDVSEQVVDLDARRATLAATRDRLRRLLDGASGVADVIAVERELARVQSDLDAMDARLTWLRSNAALASIELTLERRIVLGPVAVFFQWVGTGLGKLFVRG